MLVGMIQQPDSADLPGNQILPGSPRIVGSVLLTIPARFGRRVAAVRPDSNRR